MGVHLKTKLHRVRNRKKGVKGIPTNLFVKSYLAGRLFWSYNVDKNRKQAKIVVADEDNMSNVMNSVISMMNLHIGHVNKSRCISVSTDILLRGKISKTTVLKGILDAIIERGKSQKWYRSFYFISPIDFTVITFVADRLYMRKSIHKSLIKYYKNILPDYFIPISGKDSLYNVAVKVPDNFTKTKKMLFDGFDKDVDRLVSK